MPPYTVVPGGKGVVPWIKCSISALQALTLAGYQPTGNIRSRVRMVASFYGGPLIRVSKSFFGGTGFPGCATSQSILQVMLP
jgi:hypothetical protein